MSLNAIKDRLADWRISYALLTASAAKVHILRDMITLLTFVTENRVIGTSSTGNMPLKVVRQLAPLLSKPPTLDVEIEGMMFRCRSEQDVWQLYFLHVLAEVGGLIRTGRSRRWILTTQGNHFLKSEPDVQLAFMLSVWWHQVNWLVAYPFDGMGDDLPWGFAGAALMLSCSLPTEMDIPFIQYADRLIESTGLIWGAPDSVIADDMLRSSIERMITDVLAKFGALECRYRDKPVGKGRMKDLETIRLTPLGRALLEALALIAK